MLPENNPKKVPPPLARLTCGHCRTENVVGECRVCGGSYVLTTAHVSGRARDAAASVGPVDHLRAIFHTYKCDVCRGAYSGVAAEAEALQRTCPACGGEFLSQHGR